MSDFVRLHRWPPTRLPRPWDSLGKNTGVDCHFLSNAWNWNKKVKSTLGDLMDCSLPGSSVHGTFQARVLEWGAMAFSVKRSLVFPILLFSCISLYFSLKQAFLPVLAILRNSAFSWVYLALSPFLFLAIYKASSDNHLSSCISFSLGWFWIPPPVQCYEPPSI